MLHVVKDLVSLVEWIHLTGTQRWELWITLFGVGCPKHAASLPLPLRYAVRGTQLRELFKMAEHSGRVRHTLSPLILFAARSTAAAVQRCGWWRPPDLEGAPSVDQRRQPTLWPRKYSKYMGIHGKTHACALRWTPFNYAFELWFDPWPDIAQTGNTSLVAGANIPSPPNGCFAAEHCDFQGRFRKGSIFSLPTPTMTEAQALMWRENEAPFVFCNH